MKARMKNIMDKVATICIYGIGIATLMLILFTTVYGVIQAATNTSMCIFGVIQ